MPFNLAQPATDIRSPGTSIRSLDMKHEDVLFAIRVIWREKERGVDQLSNGKFSPLKVQNLELKLGAKYLERRHSRPRNAYTQLRPGCSSPWNGIPKLRDNLTMSSYALVCLRDHSGTAREPILETTLIADFRLMLGEKARRWFRTLSKEVLNDFSIEKENIFQKRLIVGIKWNPVDLLLLLKQEATKSLSDYIIHDKTFTTDMT